MLACPKEVRSWPSGVYEACFSGGVIEGVHGQLQMSELASASCLSLKGELNGFLGHASHKQGPAQSTQALWATQGSVPGSAHFCMPRHAESGDRPFISIMETHENNTQCP